ncbi:MAG TPA: nucleoside hydrolase [Planctomycetota bacterium]|nr:nucleoside hydrolase [Planctomycetota bacterium]
MKKFASAAVLLFIFSSSYSFAGDTAPQGPVKIIFDTDMDSDCDDVGALAMLHVMADRGEAEILATIVSARNDWSAPCVDAINTWFGRPDIPIGAPKGNAAKTSSKFAKQIAQQFPQDLGSHEKADDAAQLYRKVLMAQPDDSVVIMTVGDLTNIADLLRLPADGDKPAGLALVKAKVKKWVCMGGNFIGHPAKDDLKLGNNNFTVEKAGTYYAIQNWPVKLVFVGREIGSVPSGLKVGARLKELPETNPVRMGYQYYFNGDVKDRHVADQTTVLYAVRGLRDYWDIEEKGYMDLQPDMTFEWRYDKNKQHAYLLKKKIDGKPNDRLIETAIEELMMTPPKKAK